jgi:hypothetical protein
LAQEILHFVPIFLDQRGWRERDRERDREREREGERDADTGCPYF